MRECGEKIERRMIAGLFSGKNVRQPSCNEPCTMVSAFCWNLDAVRWAEQSGAEH